MPLVKINILDVWADHEKNKINNIVHQSLVKALKIPENDYNQRTSVFSKNDWIIPDTKTDKIVVIEILIFPGRSPDAKKKLYKLLYQGLNELGLQKGDLLITLVEPPLINWGLKEGDSAEDIDFGFDIKI